METTRPIPQLNVSETISSAWTLTKKHLPLFLLLTILTSMASSLPNSIYYYSYLSDMTNALGNGYLTEEQWIAMQVEQNPFGYLRMLGYMILAGFVCWFIVIYLNLTAIRMLLDAVTGRIVDLTTSLKSARHGYWFYFGCYLLFVFITGFAALFCIIPGVYLGVRLMFVPIIAAHHPEYTCSQVFSKAWDMTKNNFWNLLVLGIVVFLLNILGLLCCCVGIIVTSILSQFVYAVIYKQLASGMELFEESTPEIPVVETTTVQEPSDYNKSEK